jgi:hypothetical protein
VPEGSQPKRARQITWINPRIPTVFMTAVLRQWMRPKRKFHKQRHQRSAASLMEPFIQSFNPLVVQFFPTRTRRPGSWHRPRSRGRVVLLPFCR